MELPARIEMRVGERKVLRLPGLGAAGYSWAYSLTDPGQTVAIKASTAAPPNFGYTPIAGASCEEVLTIEALNSGEVQLNLAQRRAWEKDKAPLRAHSIVVVVYP